MHRDDVEQTYRVPRGEGIKSFDNYDFGEDFTDVVNVPLMPTRRYFCVRELGQIVPGTWLMVIREDGDGERVQVAKIDKARNLIEPVAPMTGWPAMGGAVTRILGFNRHYINLKQMEEVKKMVAKGAVQIDVSKFDC